MADVTVTRVGGDVPALTSISAVAYSVYTGYASMAGTSPNLNPNDDVAAVGPDTFTNDGRTIFEVINGNAAECVVQFTRRNPSLTGEKYNATFRVTTATSKMCGPFPPGEFNDPTNNKVTVNYSVTATVTVRAFKLAEKIGT